MLYPHSSLWIANLLQPSSPPPPEFPSPANSSVLDQQLLECDFWFWATFRLTYQIPLLQPTLILHHLHVCTLKFSTNHVLHKEITRQIDTNCKQTTKTKWLETRFHGLSLLTTSTFPPRIAIYTHETFIKSITVCKWNHEIWIFFNRSGYSSGTKFELECESSKVISVSFLLSCIWFSESFKQIKLSFGCWRRWRETLSLQPDPTVV